MISGLGASPIWVTRERGYSISFILLLPNVDRAKLGFVSKLVFIPALLMSLLMVCALIAHATVRHAWPRYIPALVLLLLSLYVSAATQGYGIR